MKIGKHGLRDHLRLLTPLFGLIAGVWALRLILAAANSPHWVTQVTSVTTAVAVTVLLAVLLIHFKRYGGYTNVVVSALLLNVWAQLLVVVAIFFSYETGRQNVYSAPEYSLPGDELSHLKHIYAHLTFGVGIGTLVGAVFGSLLLALLRWQDPDPSRGSAWMRKGA
jgi:ABC-type uncharacterized transport system permease subunit